MHAECEESSLPAGGWPAFSKRAPFAPGLETCCTIVGNFSEEVKRETRVVQNRPLLYWKRGASQQEEPPKQLLLILFLKKSPERWSETEDTQRKYAEIWISCHTSWVSVRKTPQRDQKVGENTSPVCTYISSNEVSEIPRISGAESVF